MGSKRDDSRKRVFKMYKEVIADKEYPLKDKALLTFILAICVPIAIVDDFIFRRDRDE
jgi:hypothetical protein